MCLLREQILEAYVFNMIVLVFLLLTEKLTDKLMVLRIYLARNKFTRIVRAIFLPKIGLVSFKSGLYLFYLFVLIYSKVLQLDPSLEVSSSFEIYVVSMEYGLVLLIAADMFIKQLFIDNKRIEDIKEKELKSAREKV